MIHKLKLKPQFYDYMKYGTKKVEIRLYDEKRQKIKINDEIIFTKEPLNTEYFKTKVVDLSKYSSFLDLVNDIDISLLADKNFKKEELIEILNSFYPKEKQEKYGVVAIKIELESDV